MKWPLPLLAFGCLLFCNSAPAAEKPKAAPATGDEIELKLGRIVIPKLEFHNATVQEALDFIKSRAQGVKVNDRPISFTVQLQPTAPPHAEDAPATGELRPLPVNPGPSEVPASFRNPGDVRVTLALTNIPLLEALRGVTGLANLKFWVLADGIHIVPVTEPDPMFTRDFRIPRNLSVVVVKAPEALEMLKKDSRNFLESLGVIFPEGAAAILTDDATRLTIHNTRDQLDLIESIFEISRTASAAAPKSAGKN